jgi:hypothetical protein
MTFDSDPLLADPLLAERFARLAPQTDAGDWADVLRRARRLGPSNGRAPRRALLVAAVLVALFAVAGGAVALSGVGTGVPAIDRLLDGATRDFKDVPRGAPRPLFQPQRGSVGGKLRFQFQGHRYTAVGYRAADGSVCTALVEPESKRANGAIGCIGAPSLRRTLAQGPGRLSGGGGGRPTIAHGFARAEVESLKLTRAGNHGVVALSEPWRPRGPDSTPIRFFYVVTDAEPAGPRWPLLAKGMEIEARLADGNVVTLPR